MDSPRSRITDVARAAGVSTATVDRVLNRRTGVRSATVNRVLKAAAQLDYLPQAELAAAARPRPMEIAFLLPAGTNRYLQMLADNIEYAGEQLAPFNAKCRCRIIESFNPRVLAQSLLEHGRRADGVAFMALEHPLVREAVNTLAQRQIPVVTVVSDLSHSQRAAYVGLDNRAAGRSAALLLARFMGRKRGKVSLIAGSRSYRAHEEREMGFHSLMEELYPEIEVTGLREGHDDAERNYRQTKTLLEKHPDLGGIYNIGGASDGIARALKEAGVDQKVVFIGHGLSPDTRALLVDGTLDAVITQSPHTIVLNTLQIFSNLREGREPMAGIEAVRLSIVLRENLP